MSVVIVTKHGTSGTPSNLSNGELAVDIEQGSLWVGNRAKPNGRVQIASGAFVEDGDSEGEMLRWNNTDKEWEADDTIVVADNGLVGLGISNPLRQLHIKGTIPALRLEDTDTSGSFGDIVCFDGSIDIRVDHSNVAADSYFKIYIDGSEKLKMTDGGAVGIGYSNPEAMLDVNGTVKADFFRPRNGANTSPSFSFPSDTDTGMYRKGDDSLGFATGGTEWMYISDAGIVHVKTTGTDDRVAGTASGSVAGIHRFYSCTQSEYDAIATKDSNTLYIIV